MRKPFKIGQKEYKFKKDAVAHYRTILNSYDLGQSLNDSDFDDLIDLLDFDYFNYLAEIETTGEDNDHNIQLELELTETNDESEVELTITDIKIAKVQQLFAAISITAIELTGCLKQFLLSLPVFPLSFLLPFISLPCVLLLILLSKSIIEKLSESGYISISCGCGDATLFFENALTIAIFLFCKYS